MRKLILAVFLAFPIFLVACSGVTEIKEDKTSDGEVTENSVEDNDDLDNSVDSSERQLAKILPGLNESAENNCDLISLAEVKNIFGSDMVSVVNDKYSVSCLFKYGSAPFGNFNLELKKFTGYENKVDAQDGFEGYKMGKTVEVVENLGDEAFFISETGYSKVKLSDGSDYAVTGSGLYVMKDDFIVYVMMTSTDQLYLSSAERLEKMIEIANAIL